MQVLCLLLSIQEGAQLHIMAWLNTWVTGFGSYLEPVISPQGSARGDRAIQIVGVAEWSTARHAAGQCDA